MSVSQDQRWAQFGENPVMVNLKGVESWIEGKLLQLGVSHNLVDSSTHQSEFPSTDDTRSTIPLAVAFRHQRAGLQHIQQGTESSPLKTAITRALELLKAMSENEINPPTE